MYLDYYSCNDNTFNDGIEMELYAIDIANVIMLM